jgi:hypothetical protein
MRRLLLTCLLITVTAVNIQSQQKPEEKENNWVNKETLDLIIENQDLQRENLQTLIESNKDLIEERRRDFEDTRASIDSLRNLTYWLFGILLTLLLTYIGIDFFNKRGKMKELETKLNELERSLINPEEV